MSYNPATGSLTVREFSLFTGLLRHSLCLDKQAQLSVSRRMSPQSCSASSVPPAIAVHSVKNPKYLDEPLSVLCPAPSLWYAHLNTSQRADGGCKPHHVMGLLGILICHTSSHVATNGSLRVWWVSLYTCQFYSPSYCSARNEVKFLLP